MVIVDFIRVYLSIEIIETHSLFKIQNMESQLLRALLVARPHVRFPKDIMSFGGERERQSLSH